MIVATGLFGIAVALVSATQGASFTGNRLFVAATGSDAVVEFAATAPSRTLDGPGLDAPRSLAFGADGMLYVASGSTIVRFDPAGDVDAVLGAGTGLTNARGLAIGPGGNLFVTSQDRILELDRDGNLLRTIGENDALGVPSALCFGPDGHLFVAAAGSNQVIEYDSGFRKVRVLDLPSLAIPMGLAFGDGGTLYVSSFFGNEVLVVDALGNEVDALVDPAMLLPAGIAVGPNGHVYVASFFGHAILEFEDGVRVDSIVLPTGVTNPEGIAFSPYRFTARVEGKFATTGAAVQNIDDDAILSIAPGSNRLMIEFTNSQLATAFDVDAFVFHGFESANSPTAKARHALGAEISTHETGVSQGSLHVALKGVKTSFGVSHAFKPKSASGTLHRAGTAGVFRGEITTTGLLP